MNYFLWISGHEHGPYSLAEIQQSIDNGEINALQTAREEDSSDWKPLHQIARLKHPTPQKPQAKETMAPVALTPSTGADAATRKRVSGHLSFIRANTCYGALRNMIEICAGAGVVAVGLYSIALGWDRRSLIPAVGFLWLLPVLAARQAAFLLVDIADTLLIEHSTNRKA